MVKRIIFNWLKSTSGITWKLGWKIDWMGHKKHWSLVKRFSEKKNSQFECNQPGHGRDPTILVCHLDHKYENTWNENSKLHSKITKRRLKATWKIARKNTGWKSRVPYSNRYPFREVLPCATASRGRVVTSTLSAALFSRFTPGTSALLTPCRPTSSPGPSARWMCSDWYANYSIRRCNHRKIRRFTIFHWRLRSFLSLHPLSVSYLVIYSSTTKKAGQGNSELLYEKLFLAKDTRMVA